MKFNAIKLKAKSEIASLLNHHFGTSFEKKQSYYPKPRNDEIDVPESEH